MRIDVSGNDVLFELYVNGEIVYVHDNTIEEKKVNWLNIKNSSNVFENNFQYIKVIVTRASEDFFSQDEISRISGCLGYALSQLAGESLSEPTVISNNGHFVVLEYFWDSTKSRRDDPDFNITFNDALEYIELGTPFRRTNRMGPGTKGTQLVQGIDSCWIDIFVA